MKARLQPSHIVVILLLIVLVGSFFLLKAFNPKYNWNEYLHSSSEQPYGASVLYELLSETYGEEGFKEIRSDNFELYFDEHPSHDYMFFGSNYFIDSLNTARIINHVTKGNSAFITISDSRNFFLSHWLDTFSVNFLDTLIVEEVEISFKSKDNGSQEKYNYRHKYLKEYRPYSWTYFSDYFFSFTKDYNPQVLSCMQDSLPSFISLEVGKGKLYLLSTPIIFSNYHMDSLTTFRHLQECWEYFDSEQILWDSFSSHAYNKPSFSQFSESPLRFILKNRSFRWAWYMLWLLILMYVVFQSKRRQSLIPLRQVKRNNTLEYAKSIGALYYYGKDHKLIADEMMSQLYAFIRARYNIKVDKDKDKIMDHLSRVSGIPTKVLSEIFRLEIKFKYGKVAESEQLVLLYDAVNYFYKNCK